MIVDPENQNNNNNMNPDPNEFVDSSFMVSFKANENSSVSDKIKENENSSNSNGFDDFDEFENFDYDASKSAFKPLDKPVTVEPSAPAAPVEPPKASEKKDFEQVAPIDDPAFTDANVDFKEFTGIKEDPSIDKSLFESGQDLDFAGSPDSNSSFTGGIDDEFKLDEEAMAINPFKPKNADRIPPAPSMPKSGKVPDPALKPKSAPVKEEAKEEPKEAANIKTYGKVSSGVDAFKKPANKEPEVNQHKEAPKTEKPASPFVKNAVPAAAAAATAAGIASAAEDKKSPEADSPFIEVPKEAAPAPVQEEPSPFVKKGAAPVKRPSSNVAKVTQTNRPVASSDHKAPRSNEPVRRDNSIPEEKEAGSRPGTSHTSSSHGKTEIAPVTQVKKSKRSKSEKKVKEPGKGGIFGLIGVLTAIFVVLWVLDNYQTWFGKTPDTTRSTQVTAVTTTTTQADETEVSAVIDETEEPSAVTEATTTTTAAETEAETEATEETEATTETTEATTTTTTEATTTTTEEETTTTRSSSNNSPVRCSYTITNPRVTSDGFVFDLAVTNNGDDLNISRLNEFTISFNTSSTITNLTSDYFNFTSEGNNSFSATPRSGSIPAGETTNITITGTTENRVQHFYINTYHFDWS